jgi:hypothetical protein
LFVDELSVINRNAISTIVRALFKTLYTEIIKNPVSGFAAEWDGGKQKHMRIWREKYEDKSPL